MGKLFNLARMTTATTLTGTITLGSAVSGYLTFAQAGVVDGDIVDYAIKDGANSEHGTGVYTASGTTLTRNVTKSTNNNNLISLSGSAEVFISPRAETLNVEENRQNLHHLAIYQSKQQGDIRRMVNLFATGFKAATDALRGIVTGSSSNYDTTAAAASGYVLPTVTAGTDQTATHTSATQSGNTASASTQLAPFDAWHAFDKVIANGTSGAGTWVTNSVPTGWLQYQFGSAKMIGSYTLTSGNNFPARAPRNWTMKGSNTGAFAGEEVILDTRTGETGWTTGSQTRSYTIASPAPFTYYRLGVTLNNGDGTYLMMDEMTLVSATINNMTLVTTMQTADASVSFARALLEIDDTSSGTLDTDLTVEVTCNGGTNWTAAALLTAGKMTGQSGRKIVESIEVACTSGTSFGARIKTLNNKNIPVYGAAVKVR